MDNNTNSFDDTVLDNQNRHKVSSTFEGKSFGQYQILTQVGKGGMGVVYKGYDSKLNRTVAIKMSTLNEKERFWREAQTMGKLSHGNIVSIYNTDIREENPYIVMEYISGSSLKEFCNQYTPSYKQITEWMIQIGKAIEYAHNQGVIHRDLKPSNIMLADGVAKVMDFGLAKDITEQKELSQTGMIMGSLHYMSPEQAEGNIREIDMQSDIYMLGAILYQLLTGKHVFEGTYIEIINKIINIEPIPPKDIIPEIPIELESICLKAIAKQKSKRYSNANEWVNDLESFLNHQPIKAKSLGTIHRNFQKFYRNSLAPWLMLSMIGYFIFASIWLYQSQNKPLLKDLQIKIVNQFGQEKKAFTDNDEPQLIVSWYSNEKYTDIDIYGEHTSYQKIRHSNKKQKNSLIIPINIDPEINADKAIVNISLFVKDTSYRQQIYIPLDYTGIAMYRADKNRSGFYSEKSVRQSPQVMWKKKVGGHYIKLSSSPIVHGNIVYVLARQGQARQKMLAIDKNTGDIKWQYGLSYKSSNPSYLIEASPTITHNQVISSIDGDLFALEKKSGNVLWEIKNIANAEEKMNSKIFPAQTSGSPIVEDKNIYIGMRNAYCRIRKDDGRILLRYNKVPWFPTYKDGGSFSCALDEENIYFLQGNNNYVQEKEDYVVARNKNTGSIQWRYPLKIRRYRWAVPALSENNVFVVDRNTLHSLAKKSASTQGKLNWQYTPQTRQHLGSIDIKYKSLLNNNAINRDLSKDFSKMKISHLLQDVTILKEDQKWQIPHRSYKDVYTLEKDKNEIKVYRDYVNGSSPAIYNGKVYFASADGNTYAIQQKDGKKIWESKTGGTTYSSPTIAENVLYVGSDDHHLYAVNTENGNLLWKFKTNDKIISSACVSEGKLYLTSTDGYIYALY